MVKSVFVGVRLTPHEKAALDTLAIREAVNQSEALRRLIRRGAAADLGAGGPPMETKIHDPALETKGART